MSIKINDEEKDFMCCGERLELMPYAGVWALGCYNCQNWTREYKGIDEPIVIITDVIEIGGN